MSEQSEFDFSEQRPRISAAEAVEKIKKLLRLGQSGNPHEAALALERAFALAARHRIDVNALDLDGETEKIVHQWFRVGQRLSFLHQRVLAIIVSFFNVTVCTASDRAVFVGAASDIDIAWFVYGFLIERGRHWLRDYERSEKRDRRKVTKNKRRSFIQGFIYGIALQLGNRRKEMILEDSKTAIVLAEQEQARSAVMDDIIPSRKKKHLELARPTRGALMSGFARGQQTRINSPLTQPSRLALTA